MAGETTQANFITKDAPISLSVQPDVPCTPACARTRRRVNIERRRDDPARLPVHIGSCAGGHNHTFATSISGNRLGAYEKVSFWPGVVSSAVLR